MAHKGIGVLPRKHDNTCDNGKKQAPQGQPHTTIVDPGLVNTWISSGMVGVGRGGTSQMQLNCMKGDETGQEGAMAPATHNNAGQRRVSREPTHPMQTHTFTNQRVGIFPTHHPHGFCT